MEETWGLQNYSEGTPDHSRDPVCGAVVNEDKAPAKVEYDGETLYFCSAACKEKFEDDPGRYFGQAV